MKLFEQYRKLQLIYTVIIDCAGILKITIVCVHTVEPLKCGDPEIILYWLTIL